MAYKHYGSRNSGSPSWLLQRITGAVLVVLMVGHYILMHYTPTSGHTFEAVFQRMQQPFWKAWYIAFITLGLYHGLQGIWNVVRDYELKPVFGMTIYSLIIITGVAFWALGLNTIFSF
jgi:succinate dehydrogenase hydrophobic membrane anchor protein